MYQSNVLKVCDYVSLNIEEAIVDTSETKCNFKWNIPQSAYMSNQRSQVCTVEVTGGVLGCTNGVVKGVCLYYLNNGYNHYSSAGHPAIASAYKSTNQSYLVTGTGQTLTQARPQFINIEFLTEDQVQINKVTTGGTATKILTGSVTLKFSYYDAVGTGRDMQHEKTISL
tara:strand:+ start:7397 stop:7906 length:510 start_codon:yes stop_codon:yes gene_type:complete